MARTSSARAAFRLHYEELISGIDETRNTDGAELVMMEAFMKAREIMTPDPEVVTPEQPISRAATIMRDYNVGIVPVVSDPESRNLIGVITDRRDDIETVEESDDTATILAAMKRREVRRLAVTNKNGKLLGVVAQADIAVANEIPRQDVADVVKVVSEPAQPER